MKSVIIGAGTYGEVYLAYLQEEGVEIVGFLDDDPKCHGTDVKGVPVLGGHIHDGDNKGLSWRGGCLLSAWQ